MDVVRVVRRAGGHCKTGHAGTLDPLATGVLICCLGKGTKLVDRLMGEGKVYEAVVDLSAFSTTDDDEGEKEEVAIGSEVSEGDVRQALKDLTGVIEQRPPAYSAVKVGGVRAYKLARKGEEVAIKTREVRVDAIEVLKYDFPILAARVRCGKGTYIRSLARQIGEGLGTGGYLRGLRRTAVGQFDLGMAVKMDELPDEIGQGDLMGLEEVEGMLEDVVKKGCSD